MAILFSSNFRVIRNFAQWLIVSVLAFVVVCLDYQTCVMVT